MITEKIKESTIREIAKNNFEIFHVSIRKVVVRIFAMLL